ncbi:MAG: hypothetical protein HKN57_02610 [Xanthomonadales bacterium]|nr:hypothetical protein [Gammaproteobacteria bacterium]MBT8054130.1 hypothetical protein [Gammaproteobacteria bacterium]NND56119.1 hypothetical protein [Xanthomonadales bacterium]NNK51654.1 hypothetical protein [Xanthomonadales bacterium]
MKIVADLSLYPLKDGPVPEIISFIKEIRLQPGIEIVTNQLSTQMRGDFDSVTGAINLCMRKVMEASSNTVVLVVKYLNVDLEIGRTPSLTPER